MTPCNIFSSPTLGPSAAATAAAIPLGDPSRNPSGDPLGDPSGERVMTPSGGRIRTPAGDPHEQTPSSTPSSSLPSSPRRVRPQAVSLSRLSGLAEYGNLGAYPSLTPERSFGSRSASPSPRFSLAGFGEDLLGSVLEGGVQALGLPAKAVAQPPAVTKPLEGLGLTPSEEERVSDPSAWLMRGLVPGSPGAASADRAEEPSIVLGQPVRSVAEVAASVEVAAAISAECGNPLTASNCKLQNSTELSVLLVYEILRCTNSV